ncbi:MAG: methionyl-tRNA formyltransferase [Patescibacteria group bacterium]
MKKINVVYFGSPDFSAKILYSLCKLKIENCKFRVAGVVTSPDKPRGRKQILTPSPVAQTAAKYDLPVFKPTTLDAANLAHLALLKPDIFLVVSYGKIIPRSYLDAPAGGSFNIHFSLLPQYRGALPISEALRNGEVETGVTLMRLDEALDHGPIISQAKIGIDINDNCQTLTNKLTQVAIQLLAENLPRLAKNNYAAVPQNESAATVTPSTKTRTRENAFVDWEKIKAALNGTGALTIHNLIRSENPDPGAWTRIGEIEVKIIKTRLDTKYLILDTIQLPGKSVISWQQFTSGHQS